MRRGALAAVLAATTTVAALASSATPAAAHVAGFSDVKGNEFYAAAVAWMNGEGLTTGVGLTRQFQPNGPVTRAQMATFLWRLEGEPKGHPKSGFVDVPAGTYYEPAVRWMKAEGLTTGVGGSSRFAPSTALTRAEMSAFLWRYAEAPGGTAHGFVDVPKGTYFDQPVMWLSKAKITTGVGGTNRFAPHQTLTRGQMATFIWRFAGKPVPPSPAGSKSCSSFATHADAQSWYGLYAQYYGDVANLDPDGDGVACPSTVPKAVSSALSQVGVPYRTAGVTPGVGFDCSGLTQWAWRQAGVNLPRTAAQQYRATRRISKAELRPGDLVFYGSGITHVAMYIGNGQIVQAQKVGTTINVKDVDWWSSNRVGFGAVNH